MSNYFRLLTLADKARATGQHREAAALAAEAHALAQDKRDQDEARVPFSPVGCGDARRAMSAGVVADEIIARARGEVAV